MLNDTDVTSVTIVLALCLVHAKKRRRFKEWYKLSQQHTRTHPRARATHTYTHTQCWVSRTTTKFFLIRFGCPSY